MKTLLVCTWLLFTLLLVLFIQESRADDVFVQLRFEFVTPKGKFQDALYYTESTWATRKQADVDAAKQARVDYWLFVQSQKLPDPTKAELIEQSAALADKIAATLAEKVEVDAKIGALP